MGVNGPSVSRKPDSKDGVNGYVPYPKCFAKPYLKDGVEGSRRAMPEGSSRNTLRDHAPGWHPGAGPAERVHPFEGSTDGGPG